MPCGQPPSVIIFRTSFFSTRTMASSDAAEIASSAASGAQLVASDASAIPVALSSGGEQGAVVEVSSGDEPPADPAAPVQDISTDSGVVEAIPIADGPGEGGVVVEAGVEDPTPAQEWAEFERHGVDDSG